MKSISSQDVHFFGKFLLVFLILSLFSCVPGPNQVTKKEPSRTDTKSEPEQLPESRLSEKSEVLNSGAKVCSKEDAANAVKERFNGQAVFVSRAHQGYFVSVVIGKSKRDLFVKDNCPEGYIKKADVKVDVKADVKVDVKAEPPINPGGPSP